MEIFKEAVDLIGEFITECCEINESKTTSLNILYTDFAIWFQQNLGKRVPSRVWFRKELEKKYKKLGTCTGIGFKGIAVKSDAGKTEPIKPIDKEPAGIFLARVLMKQIQGRDPQCAFWFVSALSKLRYENPQMTLVCLMNFIRQEMPKAAAEYAEYCRTT